MLWRLAIALAFLWALLLPPIFTRGACTAEFDAESRRIDADRVGLSDPERAAAYWRERNIVFYQLSNESCHEGRIPMPVGVSR